jgi:aryl-alcohol dehydrogenase-like predicted oxidoreductase
MLCTCIGWCSWHDAKLGTRRALEGGRRDQVLISVKFGAQRGPDGAWLGYDARPAAVKTALAYALQRLRTDHIDIYRPARLDPKVPIEETVGAIEVKLSEVDLERIEASVPAGAAAGERYPEPQMATLDSEPADRA